MVTITEWSWTKLLLPSHWPCNICELCESLTSLKLESSAASEIYYIYIYIDNGSGIEILFLNLSLKCFTWCDIRANDGLVLACNLQLYIVICARNPIGNIARKSENILWSDKACQIHMFFFFLYINYLINILPSEQTQSLFFLMQSATTIVVHVDHKIGPFFSCLILNLWLDKKSGTIKLSKAFVYMFGVTRFIKSLVLHHS